LTRLQSVADTQVFSLKEPSRLTCQNQSPPSSRPVVVARSFLSAVLLTSLAAPALGQGATTTTLTSSPNPSAFGAPVTLTATVDALGSPLASGTVSFRDGATEIALATLSEMGIGVADVVAGEIHNCALTSGGRVFCWGTGGAGQLGYGRRLGSAVPVAVSGLIDAVSVAAGGRHSCAVRRGGAVQCWGGNSHGELGDGRFDEPSSVPVDVVGITNAVSVTTGFAHSCAVLQTGTVQCWGFGRWGSLGTGNTTNSAVPLPVVGITDAVSVSAGYLHTCAALRSGAVQCWGLNEWGQLGNGTMSGDAVTVPVSVSGIVNAVSVAAGYAHSCALLNSGAVQCWGESSRGQLGFGGVESDRTPMLTPVQVSGIATAVSVSVGDIHSCAVLDNGALQCWGFGSYGQLGNGGTADSRVPAPVTDINSAVRVTGGQWHSCAVLQTGAVQCWGYNGGGNLGNNSYTPSLIPVDVSNLALRTLATAVLTTSALPSGTRTLSAVFSGGGGLAGSIGTTSHTVEGQSFGFVGGGAVFGQTEACVPVLGDTVHSVTVRYTPAELSGPVSGVSIVWRDGSEHLALWGPMVPSTGFSGGTGRGIWTRFLFYPTRPLIRVVQQRITAPQGATLTQAEDILLRLRVQNFAATVGCSVTLVATLRRA
jgi:alpha-tubulin suppressor-like RCC1 family protein